MQGAWGGCRGSWDTCLSASPMRPREGTSLGVAHISCRLICRGVYLPYTSTSQGGGSPDPFQ